MLVSELSATHQLRRRWAQKPQLDLIADLEQWETRHTELYLPTRVMKTLRARSIVCLDTYELLSWRNKASHLKGRIEKGSDTALAIR